MAFACSPASVGFAPEISDFFHSSKKKPEQKNITTNLTLNSIALISLYLIF